MNREELAAMGLSEEEINEILQASGDNVGGGGLPHKLLKVSYDEDCAKGNWIYDPIKNEEGFVEEFEDFGKSIDMIVFSNMAQYSKFDSTVNNTTVLSNIFSPFQAKSAIDSKTGELISKLKRTDEDIKWSNILVGLVRKTGSKDAWEPFMMYARGSVGYGMNNLFQKADKQSGGKYTHIFTLPITKAKQGSITYFPLDEKKASFVELSDKEKATYAKESIAIVKPFNDWVKQVNSKGVDTPSKPQASVETEESIDEDDLAL
jgi:hypothetical protein